MDINLLKQSIQLLALASFSRSGGPGGQNVNKVNTKVTLKIQMNDLAGLSSAELEQAKNKLGNRISKEGELVITSDEQRSKQINLTRAYMRMEALISSAARLPKKRKRLKPSKAAKEARLKAKRLQSEKKAQRRLIK